MAITTYRNIDNTAYFSPTVDKFGNWLSKYMFGRNYKYSVYKQVFSTIASQTDELDKSLLRHNLNAFPHTFLDDTLDVVYTCPYTAAVSSVKYKDENDNYVAITESTESDVETWWYNSVPTRLNPVSYVATNTEVYSDILGKYIVINQYLNPPTPLTITLSTSTGIYINNLFEQEPRSTIITIVGKNEFGRAIKETFGFVYNTSFISKYNWTYVESIYCEYYDDPSLFTLTVDICYNALDEKIEDKYLSYEDLEGIAHPIFWEWDSTNSVVEKSYIVANSISDYYAGISDIDVQNKYKLYMRNTTPAWEAIATVNAFMPSSSFDNKLYFIKDDYLLVYSKLDTYPTVVGKATDYKTADPVVNLDVSVEYGYLSIKGIYNYLYPRKKISSFRFIIEDADGAIVYCVDPSLTGNNNDWNLFNDVTYWTAYTLNNTVGFLSPTLTYGDGTPFEKDLFVRLDVRLTDGTIETDTFVVEKQVKYPIYQLPLPTDIITDYSSAKLFMDKNLNLCVVADSKILTLGFINDTYIKDTNTKQLIFTYNYGDLYITDNSIDVTRTLIPFNVLNTLDNYGAVTALPRQLGEKNNIYRQRLLYIYHNSVGASRQGLVNAIGAELGLFSKNIIKITYEDPFTLYVETEAASNIVNSSLMTLNLFEYDTIQDVVDVITATGLTVTVLDSNFMSLPARCLDITNNVKYYYDLKNENKKKIIPTLLEEEYIYDVSIEGLDYVGQLNEISDLNTYTNPSCGVVGGKFIVSNVEMKSNNTGYFATITNLMVLKANPIIISSLHAGLDYHFTYDEISEYGQYIMSKSEQLYPNKWNR